MVCKLQQVDSCFPYLLHNFLSCCLFSLTLLVALFPVLPFSSLPLFIHNSLSCRWSFLPLFVTKLLLPFILSYFLFVTQLSVIISLLLPTSYFLFHPPLSFSLCSSHNYPFFINYLLIFLWCKISCSPSNFLLPFSLHKTCSLINSYSLFVTPWPLFVIKSSVGTLQQICWVFHTYQFPLIMVSVDRNRQLLVTKEQETIKVLGSSVNHIACHSSSRNAIISHANTSLSAVYIYIVYSLY